MDKRDIDLIRVLQKEEIFLTGYPFRKAAEMLGWDAGEVIERSKRLKDAGVIRRFGAALTPRNAGFNTNAMVAWDSDGRAEEAARIMAEHPRISHCYIRPRFEGFPYDVYTDDTRKLFRRPSSDYHGAVGSGGSLELQGPHNSPGAQKDLPCLFSLKHFPSGKRGPHRVVRLLEDHGRGFLR